MVDRVVLNGVAECTERLEIAGVLRYLSRIDEECHRYVVGAQEVEYRGIAHDAVVDREAATRGTHRIAPRCTTYHSPRHEISDVTGMLPVAPPTE